MTVRACPGCSLELPVEPAAAYDGYFNASPECWRVFGEVVATEYLLPAARTHQLTVDAYAAQHAGGPHPDKSVAVHLVGLHLVLQRGLPPTHVPALLNRLASTVTAWPHFDPPLQAGPLTVADVALAAAEARAGTVRGWAESVWGAWSDHHQAVAGLAAAHLPIP